MYDVDFFLQIRIQIHLMLAAMLVTEVKKIN